MGGSSLEYRRLFGELRVPDGTDEARSVCSPAAYFVELLGLLEGTFDQPALLERRPDLRQIVLDGEHLHRDRLSRHRQRGAGTASRASRKSRTARRAC